MNPTIDILGATIFEPMTVITDFLITGVAWWLGSRLLQADESGIRRSRRAWGLAFLFTGLAALFGGITHGFSLYLPDKAILLTWKGTVYSVGLSMLFAVAGTVIGSPLHRSAKVLLHVLNVTGFVIYALWMISHNSFLYVIFHYAPAMLSVACIQAWVYARHRTVTAPWIIAGVIATLLGAAIQRSGFSLHLHFNNNDLFHLVQVAGLFLVFQGARGLEDHRPGQ